MEMTEFIDFISKELLISVVFIGGVLIGYINGIKDSGGL